MSKQKNAEAALQESEARLRLAVESSNTGLWDWDLITNEVHFSTIWKKQIGYDDHEIENRFGEWRSRVHPEDIDRAVKIIDEYLAAPWPNYENEFRFRHKNGSYRWILAKASLIKDEQGRHTRMIGSHLDITARKQAEQALHESDQRYRKLFDYAPDGILIADAQSYYVDANASMCRMLGYAREEMKGLHATDIVAHAEAAFIGPALEAIKANSNYHREWQMRRKNGSLFAAEVMATMMPDGNLLAMVRDITERKHAEEHVRQLNRTYAMLSDINQLIVRKRESQPILDQACRIAIDKGEFLLAWIGIKAATDQLKLTAHAGATADTLAVLDQIFDNPQLGCAFTARALETRSHAVCNDIANDSLAVAWRDAALQRGYRAMVSLPLIVNNRCIGTFNLYANSVDFFDSEELRLLDELARDVAYALAMCEREHERHNLEQQLAQSQKMQAIGTLAGGIAHDFNNILSAIVGNAELARLDLSSEHPALASTKEILRAAQRAKELVQRILAFSSPQEHVLRPIQLQTILEEAVQLLRATIPAGVELTFYGAQSLPAVRADASQVHQVVLNLVTNAWHAIEGRSNGRIEIRLEPCRVDSTLCQIQPELQPGPHVRLSVSDTGKGLDEATRARIFEPFFTTKSTGQGAGLGLSVVHGIVRTHGGAIIVESQPEHGSTFHLYFPATSEAADAVLKEPAFKQEIRGHGEHILYLDDEESLVYLTVRFLGRHGYRVDGYTRAAEALAAFRANPQNYDLVITDYNMPNMSGMEVARQLMHIQPDARVVLASGYVRPAEIEQARALGVREIILKPDTVEELIPVIQRLLAGRPDTRGKPGEATVVTN